MEGFRSTSLAGVTHGLGADCDTNVNAALPDLVGNVLNGLQSGRAEAVDRRAAGGVWEACSERCCADDVGRSWMTDLDTKSISMWSSKIQTFEANISDTDILHHLRVDVGLLHDLLQQRIDNEV